MHQEGLVIFNHKLVELDAIGGMKCGDPVNIRGDFSNFTIHVDHLFLKLAQPNDVRLVVWL